MRRLSLALLCFLVAVPAALAAHRAAGDGVLELQGVSGVVTIGTVANPARGALWGQLDSGTLVVLDPIPKDGKLFVSGWDHRPVVKDTEDGKLYLYSGTNIRFRITGGAYRLVASGSGLDLTAVGVGVAYLNGDARALDAGSYAVDDGKWQPVPELLSPKALGIRVPFGDQTSTQTTTGPTQTTTSPTQP
jgi:hypothetical protein